jgi:GT2 family glycosyltransferase
MNLTIIIVTWNNSKEIGNCLQSLGNLPIENEVWVVDNNSSDDTVKIIRDNFPQVNLIANENNSGFAKANNQAIECSKSKYVLVLNPDTVVSEATIPTAIAELEKLPQAGMLGVKILNEDGSLQPSCFPFPSPLINFIEQFGLYRFYSDKSRADKFLSTFWAHNEARRIDWIMGAFMLVRREAIEKAGSLPEQYFMYGEDLDWGFQMRKAGYEVWFTPLATVLHYGNKSGEQLPSKWGIVKRCESKYLFCRSAYGFMAAKFIEFTDFFAQTLRSVLYGLKKNRDKTYQAAFEQQKIVRNTALKSLFK